MGPFVNCLKICCIYIIKHIYCTNGILFCEFANAWFLHRVILSCGVRGCEVERRPHNLEVLSSIPRSVCQLWDFFISPHIRCEYWCSSQEAELREISISCKNLILNPCKINMFKLNCCS